MIVNRRSFNIKPGCMQEAIQLINDVVREMGSQAGGTNPRLLTAAMGPFDVLIMEVEHENLESYQKYWDAIFGHPAMEPFFTKWWTLASGGGVNEVWDVVPPAA